LTLLEDKVALNRHLLAIDHRDDQSTTLGA